MSFSFLDILLIIILSQGLFLLLAIQLLPNKNKEAKKTIENMTITEVLQNISLTFNAIIGELLNMEKNNVPVTVYNVLDIFLKDDRALYIGLVILLTCIGIFIIDVTSPTI